jgi:hypothetical protein
MGVALYRDVHVPAAIAEQLRWRKVDVLTAIEVGWQQRSDEGLLQHAFEMRRALFTQDIR